MLFNRIYTSLIRQVTSRSVRAVLAIAAALVIFLSHPGDECANFCERVYQNIKFLLLSHIHQEEVATVTANDAKKSLSDSCKNIGGIPSAMVQIQLDGQHSGLWNFKNEVSSITTYSELILSAKTPCRKCGTGSVERKISGISQAGQTLNLYEPGGTEQLVMLQSMQTRQSKRKSPKVSAGLGDFGGSLAAV